MSNFFADLFSSIFTPGPTPTLLVATNASFAALQLLLLALLVATYSIHFLALSFISAGLWWAINWFAAELQAAKAQEEETRHSKASRNGGSGGGDESDESGTETEAADDSPANRDVRAWKQGGLKPLEDQGVRRRLSLSEQSGEMSTDSEWEKVEE